VKAAGDVDAQHLYVPADSVGSYHVFVSADIPPDAPRDITFTLSDGDLMDEYEAIFITQDKR